MAKTIGNFTPYFTEDIKSFLEKEYAINVGKCVGDINPSSNIAKAYSILANDILNIDFSNIDTYQKHSIYNLLRRMGDD